MAKAKIKARRYPCPDCGAPLELPANKAVLCLVCGNFTVRAAPVNDRLN